MKQTPMKVEMFEKSTSPAPKKMYQSIDIKTKYNDRFTKKMIDACPPNFTNGRHDPKVALGYQSVQVMEQSKAPKYDRELGKHSFVQNNLVDNVVKENVELYKNRYDKF